MKYIALAFVALMALAACSPAATAPQAVAELVPPDQNVEVASHTRSTLPANRPYTESMQNSHDPMDVVVVGEFGNGGLWTWEDISNLLGVYASPGVYQRTIIDGQPYSGVPLSYLLHFAEVNEYAEVITVVTRDDQRYFMQAEALRHCGDCLVALAPDGASLTLILPGESPAAMPQLMRLEASARQAELGAVVIPNDTQTVVLSGDFVHGGYWSWDHLENLLGVYSSFGAYVSLEYEGELYTGVPLMYLFDFAEPGAINAFVIYDRGGERRSVQAQNLINCADCLIAQGEGDTLALVLPGFDTQLIPYLAGIEAR